MTTRFSWLVPLFAILAIPAFGQQVGPAKLTNGTIAGTVFFTNPIFSQSYGATTYRKATVQVWEVKVDHTRVRGSQMGKAETNKDLKDQKTVEGNNSFTFPMPVGDYEVVCLADPPRGATGTQLRRNNYVSVKANQTTVVNYKY